MHPPRGGWDIITGKSLTAHITLVEQDWEEMNLNEPERQILEEVSNCISTSCQLHRVISG